MRLGRGSVVGFIAARLARLRFPTLFLVTGAVFLVNVVVPDVIPFVDELLLGLATALLGSLRTPKAVGEASEPRARSSR